MVCSAWFRERLRKASLKKENDMVQDIDIKSKRILLFDFDGTLIETASGNTFATDLTDMRIKMDVLNIRIDKDQNFNSDSDVVKIEVLEDGSIKYISLYHESKESSDSLS